MVENNSQSAKQPIASTPVGIPIASSGSDGADAQRVTKPVAFDPAPYVPGTGEKPKTKTSFGVNAPKGKR